MESKTKLFGHPVHPIVVAFPLALGAAAVVADLAYLITKDGVFARMAYYLIWGCVVLGGVSIVIGWRDWFAIPAKTRAKTIGLWHGLSADVFTILFAISGWLRMGLPAAPSTLALALSFIALLVVPQLGWLGGELVYKYRIGVLQHTSAHSQFDPAAPVASIETAANR